MLKALVGEGKKYWKACAGAIHATIRAPTQCDGRLVTIVC